MRKLKVVKPFFFNGLTHQEMVNLVNKELPISLKYNEELVNRVHARYPLIDKTKVILIITLIFSGWRELLLLGKVLNFHGLFFDAKLLTFTTCQGGVIFPAVKVKLSTPPPLKEP